jgi:Uncharacterised protein family (UPF0182)
MGTRSPPNSRRCPDAPACFCWQRWASLHYCSSGRAWWTPTPIGCGSVRSASAASGSRCCCPGVAIFVAVALVVGGTVFVALMLAYRSRPVFVPAARPNDPIAPYRTQVMRRSRLFGWGVAVAVGVLCALIAQSGCSAVRALSAPNWYAPDSQGRFSRVVDHPRRQVQLRQKN